MIKATHRKACYTQSIFFVVSIFFSLPSIAGCDLLVTQDVEGDSSSECVFEDIKLREYFLILMNHVQKRVVYSLSQREELELALLLETLTKLDDNLEYNTVKRLGEILSHVEKSLFLSFCHNLDVFLKNIENKELAKKIFMHYFLQPKEINYFARSETRDIVYVAKNDLLDALLRMHKDTLPDAADVKCFLEWPQWYIDKKFNTDIFWGFSHIFADKGFPSQVEIESILAWPQLYIDDEVSDTCIFSVSRFLNLVFLIKKTPWMQQDFADLLEWTETARNKSTSFLLKLMRTLFLSPPPHISVFKSREGKLWKLFFSKQDETIKVNTDNVDTSDENGEKLKRAVQLMIKIVTLFLPSDQKNSDYFLQMKTIENFHQKSEENGIDSFEQLYQLVVLLYSASIRQNLVKSCDTLIFNYLDLGIKKQKRLIKTEARKLPRLVFKKIRGALDEGKKSY